MKFLSILEGIASRLHSPWRAIVFIAAFRIPVFLYFSSQFARYWPKHQLRFFPFVEGNDTGGYFLPMESFLSGNGYESLCRMPGLLPIYVPLRLLLDEPGAKVVFVLLQLLAGIFAVYLMAKLAKRFFGNTAYLIALLIGAISSFVGIWDHFGLSDSFSIYFLVFSAYFAMTYEDASGSPKSQREKLGLLLLSSLFFTWSVFIRPVHLVAGAGLALILFRSHRGNMLAFLKTGSLYAIIPLFFVSLWSWRNYGLTGRFIPLQDAISNCHKSYPLHYVHLRDFIIRLGGDYQRTTKGGEMHWFQTDTSRKSNPPFTARQYCSACGRVEMFELKRLYLASENGNLAMPDREKAKTELIAKANFCRDQYAKEKPIFYYFLNPLLLSRQFVFPDRLDNLPFPSRNAMNTWQFLLKSGYFLLLLLVNLSAILYISFVLVSRRNYSLLALAVIPLAFIFVLSFWLGFIEQRYLCVTFPFFLLLSTGWFSEHKGGEKTNPGT